MGAGFHGHNGLNPKPSVYIYNTYVLPSLLFGLETVIVLQADLEKLDKFHKDILRRIQHLPERTALSAVFGLADQFSIEYEFHKRQLSLFGNTIREDCVERELAIRQLTLKDHTSKNWFISVKKVLHKYKLSSSYELTENPPSKYQWKTTVRRKLNNFWSQYLKAEAAKKSTLKYWNFHSITYNKSNSV